MIESSAAVDRADLKHSLDAIVGSSPYRHARLGIAIHGLDDGAVIYEHDANAYFHGASTTKLLTVASALAALGPDYRFRTEVRHTGRIASGVLHGDLVVIASGDPNLSARVQGTDVLRFTNIEHALSGMPGSETVGGDPLQVLRDLVGQLASHGLSHIDGAVRIDVSLFPEAFRETGYDAVISPVVINDNLVDITASAGERPGEPLGIALSPLTKYLRFNSSATVGEHGSKATLELSAEERGQDDAPFVRITGTLPPGTVQLYSHPIASPTRFARELFTTLLLEAGITVKIPTAGDDTFSDSGSLAVGEPLAAHLSPPFQETAKVILKVSQNLHAELCPRIVGALKPLAVGQTAELAGFEREAAFLESAHIDIDGALQGDAAGGLGFFTPNFMCRFLRGVASHPVYDAFREGLPVMGKDGTLHNIQTASAAAGHVFAKTGTIHYDDKLAGREIVTSKGLAGYIDASSGRRLVFAAYANNVALTKGEQVSDVGQLLGSIAAAAYDHL